MQAHPLSPLQQGMLFQELAAPKSGANVEQIVVDLRHPCDAGLLNTAWRRVLAKYPQLSTVARWKDRPAPEQLLAVEACDIRVLDGATELKSFLQNDRACGFELDQGPLHRVSLLRHAADHYTLVWTFHHMVLDGRSFPIVLKDWFDFHDALAAGKVFEVVPEWGYDRFLQWLPTRAKDSEAGFWRQLLQGFSAPNELTALASGGARDSRGEHRLALPRDLSDALRALATRWNVTLNNLLQFSWAWLLHRHGPDDDVVFGAVRAGRKGTIDGAESVVGLFINTLPVRLTFAQHDTLQSCVQCLRKQALAARPYEQSALADIQAWSEVPGGHSLFRSVIVFDNQHLNTTMHALPGNWAGRHFELYEQTDFALTLYAYGETEVLLRLAFDQPTFSTTDADYILKFLHETLDQLVRQPEQSIAIFNPLPDAVRRHLVTGVNQAAVAYPTTLTLAAAFAQQVQVRGDATAVVFEGLALSYNQLDSRADVIAAALSQAGVVKGDLVGICIERSLDMVASMLAVLKIGAAYVPLDPNYPLNRLQFIVEDSKVKLILAAGSAQRVAAACKAPTLSVDSLQERTADQRWQAPSPDSLAYVIYTSGSTGKPKGVMVRHRNVINFFAGMDQRVPHQAGDVFLAVTSISFDISVLELLWTLCRGFKVVVQPDDERKTAAPLASSIARPLSFSAFFFGANDDFPTGNKYRLLLETARFADAHGFQAIWTPERHFHGFGGLYPSPSVLGAAIAVITRQIQIRAGSVVLPLHDPLRVAEEWSVVDNLSGGRVGVSFASGWHANDFVLAPDKFQDRKAIMYRDIEAVRRLWAGEKITRSDGAGSETAVGILPRPVQSALPIWVTAAGAPDTFAMAGTVGANVLTHLLGQDLNAVADRINTYRAAWREAGHPGEGRVTIMLHTFVGDDLQRVHQTVRQPMLDYIKTSSALVSALNRSLGIVDEHSELPTDSEMAALWERAFERFFQGGSLLGTAETCMSLVDRLKQIGVDEVACLLDFGVDSEQVLQQLQSLAELKDAANRVVVENGDGSGEDWSIPAQIKRHRVTHLQSTPSLVNMLMPLTEFRQSVAELKCLLVGGEALPLSLVRELEPLLGGQLINMYGPTETTIWSSTYAATGTETAIPIGTPIANTELYIMDAQLRLLPPGVEGELLIGGEGVTPGYLGREQLTAERFVDDPFRGGSKLYRTGDLCRLLRNGNFEYKGRSDFQVKFHGFRIELGEIEAVLAGHATVQASVVVVREDVPGDQRLVAYVVAEPGQEPQPQVLISHARELLPSHMLPSAVVVLEKLPLTPNGKTDRKALPAPDRGRALSDKPYAPPENAAETSIAEAWRTVLALDTVGRNDNFFDLGGHSLHMVSVLTRLRAVLDPGLQMVDLFRYPTVQTLSERINRGGADHAALQTESRDRSFDRRQALKNRAQRRRT